MPNSTLPRVSLRRVRLNAGGYTSQGYYFGSGAALYEATDADGNHHGYFRGAKPSIRLSLQARLPHANVR